MPIRVLDPTQPPEVMPVTLASRKTDYGAVNLGLLSNGKSNAVKLLRLVKDQLVSQLQIEQVVEAEKESASTNAAEELIDQLADGSDLALVAIGD